MAVRRILTAAVLVGVLALVACGGSSAARSAPTGAAPRDPSAAGPYAIGLTRMTFGRPANADGTARALDTWIWYPAAGSPDGDAVTDAAPSQEAGPFPIVIFSHGSGGQPQFYSFFAKHLASWGFVVAAPSHPGNTSADCVLCDSRNIIASARERPDDVTFTLDRMLALRDDASQPLGAIIDPERHGDCGAFIRRLDVVVRRAGRPIRCDRRTRAGTARNVAAARA